jgi:hypothetical protein
MTRIFASDYRDRSRKHPDPYPVHLLKRVDSPTTWLDESAIRRVDERDGGFQRAKRGEYGPFIQKEYRRFMGKYPLSNVLLAMSKRLAVQDAVDGQWQER